MNASLVLPYSITIFYTITTCTVHVQLNDDGLTVRYVVVATWSVVAFIKVLYNLTADTYNSRVFILYP